MIHARADYQRIQDPAANAELLAAYAIAMKVIAHGPRVGDDRGQLAAAYVLLSQLARALHSTLEPVLDGIASTPIAVDEPVFLLRGQDAAAPDTIRRWAELTYDRGAGNSEASRSAIEHAERMETWQAKNGCKRADLPRQVGV